MNIGDKFPDLLGTDAEGNEIRLGSFPGKEFIIFFYPKDSTPGCTAESCSLQSGLEAFSQMGYQVIGVSGGTAATHSRFAEKNGLTFPLVLDADHKLAELAGVWQLKKLAGREYMGIVRTTFVTDNEGNVTDIIRKVDTKAAAEQLFNLLDNRNNPNPA